MEPESRRPEPKNLCGAVTKNPSTKICWRGYSIYLESLQYRYQIEVARNRGDRIKAFEDYMSRTRQG